MFWSVITFYNIKLEPWYRQFSELSDSFSLELKDSFLSGIEMERNIFLKYFQVFILLLK